MKVIIVYMRNGRCLNASRDETPAAARGPFYKQQEFSSTAVEFRVWVSYYLSVFNWMKSFIDVFIWMLV